MGSGLSAKTLAAGTTSGQVILTAVDTIADLRLLNVSTVQNGALVYVRGYYGQDDGGEGFFTYVSDETDADNGGTIIAPTVGSGRWLRVFSGPVNVRWYGLTGDSPDDVSATLQSIITDNRNVFVPNGIYLLSDRLDVISNSRIKFEKNAWLKLTSPGSIGETVRIYSNDANNIDLIGLNIDNDNNTGINGIGISHASNIRIFNTQVKNVKRSPSTGGGRAVTLQFAVHDVIVDGLLATDCTTAFDVNGRFEDASYNQASVDRVLATNIVAVNCEEALSFYDIFNGDDYADQARPDATNVRVQNVTAFNCGLSTPETSGGSTTGTDGGVIVFVRARFITIDGVKIYNEDDYGAVGGLVRGTSKYCRLWNVDAYMDAIAVFNLSSAANLLPVVESLDILNSHLEANNVRVYGDLDYVVYADQSGVSYVERITLAAIGVDGVATGILNSLCTNDDCYLDVQNTDKGGRVSGTWDRILAENNTLPTAAIASEYRAANLTIVGAALGVTRDSANDQFRIERTGSNSGYFRLFANDDRMLVGGDDFVEIFEVDIANKLFGVGTGQGTWDTSHLILGSYHLWVDSTGDLRIKSGAPSSDTDGTVVGTQT